MSIWTRQPEDEILLVDVAESGEALMRIVILCALVAACLLSNCTYFPGFDDPLIFSSVNNVPEDIVKREVVCELRDFLNNEAIAAILEPNHLADVVLNLVEEQDHKISYVGIDLQKLGLTAAANLLALNNKVPSLQASGQMKSTVSVQPEFQVRQSGETKCAEGERTIRSLYLKEWLLNHATHNKSIEGVCDTKITLKTTFAVVVDVQAGISPTAVHAFILPISTFNYDYNPTFTHTFQITFYRKKSNQPFCKATATPEGKFVDRPSSQSIGPRTPDGPTPKNGPFEFRGPTPLI